LARAIRDLPGPAPDVLILANHGLIIAADDFASARVLLADVTHRLRRHAREAPPADVRKLASMNIPGFRLPDDAEVHGIGTDPYSTTIAMRGTLFPDQCVYLGAPAVIHDQTTAAATIEEFRAAFGLAPKYLIVPGAGVLVSETLDRAGWEMLVAVNRVIEQIDPSATIQVLDVAEVSRLLNWDAEKYRQALATQFSLSRK
jgi:rhamnose utilization protein RhaD (predicted bifunctional aldolase and dehydrogenase)